MPGAIRAKEDNMSRIRSVWSWSSKGIIHPVPQEPGMDKLVSVLSEIKETIRDAAPYEAKVLGVAVGRLPESRRDCDFYAVAMFLFGVANGRRDLCKVNWAEIPEEERIEKSIRRAALLLDEYTRIVLRKANAGGEHTIEEVLRGGATG